MLRKLLMLGTRSAGLSAIAACLLIAAAPPARACPTGDVRCERLDQLLKFLRYEESIAQMKKSCVDARSALHPDAWFKSEPDAFFGLTPASRQWPLVVQSFEEYVREACGEPSSTALLEKYREAWNRRLSDPELDAIVSFFNSSAGSAFSDAMAPVYREFFEFYEPLASRSSIAAWTNYGQSIAAIARGR